MTSDTSDRYEEPESTRLPAAVPVRSPAVVPEPSPAGDASAQEGSGTGRRPGIWRREAAVICDAVILSIVGYVLGWTWFESLARLGPWGRLVGFSIALAYFAIFNSRIGGGQTPGKRLFSIRVLAVDGSPLTLSRSVVRYAVLGAPYFLNNLAVPATRVPLLLIALLSTLLITGYGAIVYLYLFNRRTRRSLHDLAAGSVVVRTRPGPIPSGPLWKGHLVVLGLIYLVLFGAGVFLSRMAGVREQVTHVMRIVQAVESTDVVQSGRATMNVFFGPGGRTTRLDVTALLKQRPASYEQEVLRIADVALAADPSGGSVDAMQVAVSFGYDLGISKKYEGFYAILPPRQWRDLFPEKAAPPGEASSEPSGAAGENAQISGAAQPSCSGIVDYGGTCGITNPEIIQESKVVPVYPDEARLLKVQGQVVLRAVVTKEGTVTDVVPQRSPNRRLTRAAIDAVSRWRYRPGLKDGRPVTVYFTIVVDFVLNPVEK